MNFLKSAIVSLVALAGFTKAHMTQEQFDARLKNGQFDMKTLMAGAKPHSDAAKAVEGQRLLENQSGVTSMHSIQFLTCFSMTSSYNDIFENGGDGEQSLALNLWMNGKMVAERSYAIFKLCYTNQCDYTGDDPSLEYIIDLSTFVQAFVTYLPTQVENYCTACEANQDYCLSTLGYGNYGGGNYYGGGNRHLGELESRDLQDGQIVRQLDCEMCMTYGCLQQGGNKNNNVQYNGQYQYNNGQYNGQYQYNNGQQQGEDGFSAGAEWLSALAQCYATGAYYNSYANGGSYYYNGGQGGGGDGNQNQLYASFICNAAGNGVEIGMFLDEECILYLTDEPYSNYMSYFDQTYVQSTKDIIEFTFTSRFSCSAAEVTYTVNDVSGYQQYYANDQNYNNNGDAAEWCTMLYENDGGSYPARLYDCYAGQEYEQQEQQDWEYEYQAGNGEEYYQYIEEYNNAYREQYQQQQQNGYYDYSQMYKYEINEEYALDMTTVCMAVKRSNGDLHTFYNSNNGQTYDFGSTASDSVQDLVDETGGSTVANASLKSLSGGAKFGIVMLVGVVVGAIVALVARFRSSGDEKAEPLVEQNDGTMA